MSFLLIGFSTQTSASNVQLPTHP